MKDDVDDDDVCVWTRQVQATGYFCLIFAFRFSPRCHTLGGWSEWCDSANVSWSGTESWVVWNQSWPGETRDWTCFSKSFFIYIKMSHYWFRSILIVNTSLSLSSSSARQWTVNRVRDRELFLIQSPCPRCVSIFSRTRKFFFLSFRLLAFLYFCFDIGNYSLVWRLCICEWATGCPSVCLSICVDARHLNNNTIIIIM